MALSGHLCLLSFGLAGPMELNIISLIICLFLIDGSKRLSRSVDRRGRDPAFRQTELLYAAWLRRLAQYVLVMAAVFAVVGILLGLLHRASP